MERVRKKSAKKYASKRKERHRRRRKKKKNKKAKREMCNNLTGLCWSAALRQKEKIARQANSEEDCVARMSKIVNEIATVWCQDQRVRFPSKQINTILKELEPPFLQAFKKQKLIEQTILKQVSVQLDDQLEQMKGTLNLKKNAVKGMWEARKAAGNFVRNELFKNKQILIESCEGKVELIKPKVLYFIQQKSRDFMQKKNHRLPSSAFVSLQAELTQYMTDEFEKYHGELERKAEEAERAPQELRELLEQCEETVMLQMESILDSSSSVKEVMARADYAMEEFFSHRAKVSSSSLWRRVFNQTEDPERKALKKKLRTVFADAMLRRYIARPEGAEPTVEEDESEENVEEKKQETFWSSMMSKIETITQQFDPSAEKEEEVGEKKESVLSAGNNGNPAVAIVDGDAKEKTEGKDETYWWQAPNYAFQPSLSTTTKKVVRRK